ncbi:MAG: tol-pal system protein YbgF, partial [Gammaproteobacteria bacterium]|nr:tol-pal system protein YbgF [Gammaproteobacteria bacterium]
DSVDTKSEAETSLVTAGEVKDKEGEQVAYQKAFDLLRALRYEKATLAFRQFLIDYPDGRYAHIAQYWLAETSYHTRKFDIAVKDYQTLINKYPKSPKRADALLKIGYSQFELKSFAESKAVLEKLIQSYPGTTEAGQAENLLQKIRLQKLQ